MISLTETLLGSFSLEDSRLSLEDAHACRLVGGALLERRRAEYETNFSL